MMTERQDTTYNGWTNYETWCVNLWLTNDQGTQEWVNVLVERATRDAGEQSAVQQGIWTREQGIRFLLADSLREFVEENNPLEGQASMFTDLLTSAIQRTNWDEIARSYLDA